MLLNRRQLRLDLRRRRRSLPRRQRAELAFRLSRQVASNPVFLKAKNIACYLANDGEMDLGPLMARMWSMGKRPFLPVLRHPRLWFLPLTPKTVLAESHFGIEEPVACPASRCPAPWLDLVLMPLVGFDDRGNRLGMGGGYYDQTFAYLHRRRHWHRPRLIGVAYELQRVAALDVRPWDVPLGGIVTENGLRLFPSQVPGQMQPEKNQPEKNQGESPCSTG